MRIPPLVTWLPLAASWLISCQSIAQDPFDFEQAPLFGMIYDADNQPVDAAQVFVDAEKGPRSDLNGRFVLPDLARGAHEVRVEKRGYESLATSVDFTNRTQVLYLRMTSMEQLLNQADLQMERREWQEAAGTLERAKILNADHPELQYEQAILAYKTSHFESSAAILEGLVANGHREPYVWMFLADLYQYHLNLTESSVRALEEYLKLRGDEQAQQRLEALRRPGSQSPDASVESQSGVENSN